MRGSHSIAILSVLGMVCAQGQPIAEALDQLNGRSVEELVALALRQNGELLAGQQRIAGAHGGLTQAALRPNPSMDVTGSHEVGGTQNNIVIAASVPLELYHRRERRMEVASSIFSMSKLDQAERERQLRAEVEGTFGDMLASLRDLQFTREQLALARDELELVAARAEKGSAAPLEANLLRVEVNRIDAAGADLEAQAEVNLLALKSLVGLRPDEPLRVRGSLDPLPFAANKDEAIQTALQNRPDLLSARAAEQVAAAKLKQAEAEAKPEATLSANYQRMNSSFNQLGFNAAGQQVPIQGVFHYLAGGISISLPVRNRNQGAIEAAVAEMEEAKRRSQYAELIIAREVTAAFVAREKAKESVAIYATGVRGQATENLSVIRRTYELGRVPLQDVIAEQRRLVEIERAYTEALSRQYQATVRLRTAVAEGSK